MKRLHFEPKYALLGEYTAAGLVLSWLHKLFDIITIYKLTAIQKILFSSILCSLHRKFCST